MNTNELLLWAGLLLIQNFSFTLVSRARNSSSILYHAFAAVGSNGVWFACQFILVSNFLALIKSGTALQIIFIGAFYTFFTVIGSIASHYICMRWIEKGKRKIGS
jgi:hypothetical protein